MYLNKKSQLKTMFQVNSQNRLLFRRIFEGLIFEKERFPLPK